MGGIMTARHLDVPLGYSKTKSRYDMIPDLQASLLCDDVRQERNGKFILIGIFDGLVVAQIPAMFPRLCLVNRWCCGHGQFTQRSRIVGPDGTSVACEGQAIPIQLQDEHQVGTTVEVFMNLQFQAPGAYWVEVLLDQQLRLRYPLHVKLAPPATNHPQQPPGAAPSGPMLPPPTQPV